MSIGFKDFHQGTPAECYVSCIFFSRIGLFGWVFLQYVYIKAPEKEAQPCKCAMFKKKMAMHGNLALQKHRKVYFIMSIFRVAVKSSADSV